MNTNLLKTFFVALLLITATGASAHDFEVDGIYYNITDATAKTVEVTYKGGSYYEYGNEYTGSVVIPSMVTYNNAAYSVTSIGNSAFRSCSGLTGELIIPNSVTSVGYDAFYGCSGLIGITIPNSVTSIGNSAFSGCTGLTGVTIPNSVTSIGDGAFYNCIGLTSITIPNSVTSIGDDAFYGTAWYNNQPDGLVYAGKVLYKYKGTMPKNTSITIKEGTLGIVNSAFYDCSGLIGITIPNSVTSIGKYAFYDCSGLTGITIPNSVTSIGRYAFYRCSGLKEVHISDLAAWCKIDFEGSVSNPLYYAHNLYLNGEKVTNFVIPDGVTEIKDYAFYNCSSLTGVTIGNSVTSIGEDAFDGTAWYNNQPDGLVYAGKVLYKYKGTMPQNTSITIKEGTLGIGSGAFSYCTGLTSITIPNSVTSIGDYAFYRCTGLKEIYSLSETPATISSDTFSDYSAMLYVPLGAKGAYQAVAYWKNFTNIVEMDYTDIDEIEADDSFNCLRDTYYDLKGSVVENPTKGIYIYNGKKVLVQ